MAIRPLSEIAVSEAVGATMGEFTGLTEREQKIARYAAGLGAKWMKRLLISHLVNLEI